jgi:hypothetical protein
MAHITCVTQLISYPSLEISPIGHPSLPRRSGSYRAFWLNLMSHITAMSRFFVWSPLPHPVEFYYMFYGTACHISTAEDWMALDFKVAVSVALMPFLSDCGRNPKP